MVLFHFPSSYLPPFLHWGHSRSTNTSYYVRCVSIKIHVSINLDLTCAKSQGCQKVASCERYFDILAGPCIDRDALIKEQRRVCGPKANNILAPLLAASLLSVRPFPGNRLPEWTYLCAFCRPRPQPSPSTSSLSSNHSASPNVTSSAPSSARGENCIWQNEPRLKNSVVQILMLLFCGPNCSGLS